MKRLISITGSRKRETYKHEPEEYRVVIKPCPIFKPNFTLYHILHQYVK